MFKRESKDCDHRNWHPDKNASFIGVCEDCPTTWLVSEGGPMPFAELRTGDTPEERAFREGWFARACLAPYFVGQELAEQTQAWKKFKESLPK